LRTAERRPRGQSPSALMRGTSQRGCVAELKNSRGRPFWRSAPQARTGVRARARRDTRMRGASVWTPFPASGSAPEKSKPSAVKRLLWRPWRITLCAMIGDFALNAFALSCHEGRASPVLRRVVWR